MNMAQFRLKKIRIEKLLDFIIILLKLMIYLMML